LASLPPGAVPKGFPLANQKASAKIKWGTQTGT
jgi:hypothetical protein